MLPDNSRLALLSDLRAYAAFCVTLERRGLPADPELILSYMEALESAGRRLSTVRRHLASITWLHKAAGLPTPCNDAQVRERILALKGRIGGARVGASGLRYEEEEPQVPCVSLLLRACGEDVRGARDAALLTLAYEGGLRPSELVAVRVEHVEATGNGGLLHLPGRAGKGSRVPLSAAAVERVARWCEDSGLDSGPLFRRVMIDRRKARPERAARTIADLAPNAQVDATRMAARAAIPAGVCYRIGLRGLTVHGVTHIVRRLLRAAAGQGLIRLGDRRLEELAARLSARSLRMGMAHDMLAAGEEFGPVAQTLGWRSRRTVARYSRRGRITAGGAA